MTKTLLVVMSEEQKVRDSAIAGSPNEKLVMQLVMEKTASLLTRYRTKSGWLDLNQRPPAPEAVQVVRN
jgi:hypothetical protein